MGNGESGVWGCAGAEVRGKGLEEIIYFFNNGLQNSSSGLYPFPLIPLLPCSQLNLQPSPPPPPLSVPPHARLKPYDAPMMPDPFIRADEVLHEKWDSRALQLELEHGNGGLLGLVSRVGSAGPFRTLSPWELEDPQSHRTLNASGYSALPFGDNYPPLLEFVRSYLEKNRQIGLPQQSVTPWRAALETNLIRLLAQFAPSHADSRVFFSNSGTEAVEGAIKFAKAARPRAKHLIHFSKAYHGKTLLSLSLTPNPSLQRGFEPWLIPTVTLPFGDLEQVKSTLKKLGPDNVVCVLLEPIQGEAGVVIPPPGFLRGVGELCQKYGIPSIADEIQSGLGRTGHWFESLAQGWEPDIICLAKPLGGGLTAVGATLMRDAIFKKLLGKTNDVKRHSNTFGGNSLAMAIGLKSLEILREQNLPERSERLGKLGLERLLKMKERHPELLAEVRGAGMLMAMVFRPVIGTKWLPIGGQIVGELTGLLAQRAFYQGGVQLNFTLNVAKALRVTPAMNMPEELFEELLLKLEHTIERTRTAGRLLTGTSRAELLSLAEYVLKNG